VFWAYFLQMSVLRIAFFQILWHFCCFNLLLKAYWACFYKNLLILGLFFRICLTAFSFKFLADFSFCWIFMPTYVGLVFRLNYLFLACFSNFLACFCKITWHHCCQHEAVPEMSGLSYFAVQIQSCIFKTQSKSNHSPKKFKKFQIQVQIKSKKLTKYKFLMKKIKKLKNSFPLTQFKSGYDPKFMKHFTVRVQSKINKSRHSPDPVRSKSSPMLISDLCQRWSDSDFSLSDPILFLKNDIRIRSESCSGWNHTIRIRKLSESVLWCTTYIFVLCLFCLMRQNNFGVILPWAEQNWLK